MALRALTYRTTMVTKNCWKSLPKNSCVCDCVYKLNKSTKPEDISQTTILFEDGIDIQELPVIVRKIKTDNFILVCENKFDDPNNNKNGGTQKLNDFDSVNIEECLEAVEGFNRCYTARGIFALLETMPSNEVTPFVALQALKKIITLENNKQFRNKIPKYNEDLHPNETFTRAAILNQLVDKIASSNDADTILRGLQLVSRDMVGTDTELYKNKLRVEVLCHVTDGKFNISQTCEAVKIFSSLDESNVKDIDKLWVGISQKSLEINETNIMDVFRCLPYFKKSRRLILNIVEKKLMEGWWYISGNNVSEILLILRGIRSFSPKILGVLGRWTNTNIHTVSEDDLLEIINGFYVLDYTSTGIENALERYIKAKGVRVKNPLLLSTIMDYCSKFRIRSVHLLQGSAEYIVTYGKQLSPVLLKSLFSPLGYLNYQPSNALLFWQALEGAFEEKFIQFRPEDAIDMLLTCIYLQKYPLNFVKKVFNPYFLDRLHSSRNVETLNVIRSKLKMLDTAMTLECEHYRGPLLPKDHSSKSIWQDGRIRRILNNINNSLNKVAGGEDRLSYCVPAPQLPMNEIYMIDALIHPSSIKSALWHMNILKDCNLYTAILVHLPEHFCNAGKNLIGNQAMRIRHFEKMGLKVISLNYERLARLKMHPLELQNYIEDRFKKDETSEKK